VNWQDVEKHPLVKKLIALALEEDNAYDDVTSGLLGLSNIMAEGLCISKGRFVLAGCKVAAQVFLEFDASVQIDVRLSDGTWVGRDEIIFKVAGKASSLLAAERTSLNILQNLCGVATLARRLKNKLPDHVKPYGTRKTSPGMRLLQKYAIYIGGGEPHRLSLSDGILIKDNHIRCIGSIGKSISLVRENNPDMPVEVEVHSLSELPEALDADIIMLDNLPDEDIQKAMEIIQKFEKEKGKRPIIEVSGNIDEKRAYKVSKFRIDRVSCGYLTHSIHVPDISFEISGSVDLNNR
jgi:nicotinate-nucleotide pyrophosphorylase (carboxylating)